jgi:ketosteroid isomerase-like protein
MTDTSIATRIAQLEAREALRELIARYCTILDGGDFRGTAALFTEDGAFIGPTGPVTGREALVAFWTERTALWESSFHYTHDHVFTFTSETEATGVVTGHAENGVGGQLVRIAYAYDDAYRRGDDGVWRFASRSITFRYMLPWSALDTEFELGAMRLPTAAT